MVRELADKALKKDGVGPWLRHYGVRGLGFVLRPYIVAAVVHRVVDAVRAEVKTLNEAPRGRGF
jgi:hypothetical protein